MLQNQQVQPRKLIVFCGPSQTGKSEKAWELAGDDTYSKDLTKYWCGYQSQRNVIIDQYRGKDLDVTILSQWLNGHDVEVPTKGGRSVSSRLGIGAPKLVAEVIYITTLLHPRDWRWRGQEDIIDRLEVVDFTR